MIREEKICVLGMGYIGLPTAALFATYGYEVVGVDINATTVEKISRAEADSREPGLKMLVRAAVESRRLSVQMLTEEADVFIVAVPTPFSETRTADLSSIVAATESIVPYLRPGNMVILESTVPPGTTVNVVVPVLEQSGLQAGRDFHVVHAPERVLPGRILEELAQNDRVLGGIDWASAERARDLYASFVTGQVHLTDATTAELVKLMENTYRDVNIALANSFARIGDKLAIDIWAAIDMANRHPRVDILRPGPGVGGHCIAVDPWFIVEKAKDEANLIVTARHVNDAMPVYIAQSIESLLDGILHPKVAVLGAAYKANVADTRESPSLHLVELLEMRGFQVQIHDPHVFPSVSLIDAVQGADCLALLVNHREYASLDPWSLGEMMRHRVAFDAQNHLPADLWQSAGFHLKTLGQGRNTVWDQDMNRLLWLNQSASVEC